MIKKDEKQIDVKTITLGVQNLRKAFTKHTEEVREALDSLDIKLASYGGSQSEILKSLQFLKDIHAQGGTVSNEALADIAKKNKYDRYGSFYKGKKASLVKVQSDGKEMVALTRNGMDRLVAAGLIEE